ncbi:MAG TPA: cytochrome c biogenesis CcdA family protein [Syntrophomonadaceae bacterium]|nr:cytochrome c biogenesis protein CcdA [Syntrophomonadaceae bacterium]HOQ10031.1 cytochrome c biogenesis CcdA family protein [Syntrophomonadaceae bacterium]HPU49134.1 cytochrome c biogenesis CcdA family protein [Syntrophomonadaceae bacterium]
MEQWINQVVPELIQSFSLLGYGLVFLAGIATSITPCNVSMVPVIIAHVSGSRAGRKKGFVLSSFFTLGTATTFMLLGLIIASIGGIFGTSQKVIYYFVAGVCIIIGLNLLGLIPLNFSYGYGLTDRVGNPKGYLGSYMLGMVMGLAGSQCGTPIMLAILSLALAKGQWLYGAVLLFIYALGRGVPIVVVGTFTGLITHMDAFARWSGVMNKVAGFLLLGVGSYFIWIS